jgi:hypothetical protein
LRDKNGESAYDRCSSKITEDVKARLVDADEAEEEDDNEEWGEEAEELVGGGVVEPVLPEEVLEAA